MPLKIAALISGGGATLKNLIEHVARGSLPIEIALCVSSNPRAGGIEIAARAGIPTFICERNTFGSPEEYRAAIFDRCRDAHVGLVVMAGFLKFVPIPADFAFRVVNIHPALIPAFCGHGMYGRHVHAAALDYGVKLSGCTVHFVDNEYDHGPILLQETVPVEDNDTPDTLAARVFSAEREAYPAALRLLAAGRVSIEGRQVRIGPSK